MSELDDASDRSTRRRAGLAGAAVFGAASVTELVRMLTRAYPWPGFTGRLTWLISAIGIVLWIASTYVLAVRRREYIVLAISGAFALVCHGLFGTIAGSSFGIVYVLLGAVMVLLERLAFGGKLTIGTRWTPTRPVAEPRVI